MAGITKRPKNFQGTNAVQKIGSSKILTCAQRIEAATVHRTQVSMSEAMVEDAEALFNSNDSEGTQLLSRGALTELLKQVGLESALGSSFSATARLAFDAHSADSHFLSKQEFKQLYYVINQRFPDLLPRPPFLKINILSATGLAPADANGKSDPFVAVQIVGKSHSKSQTSVQEKTLAPEWGPKDVGEEFSDRYAYEEGDTLEFIIYDFDKGTTDFEVLGKGRLHSSDFHKVGGFSGDLQLTDSPNKKYTPSLKVRVVATRLESAIEASNKKSGGTEKLKQPIEQKILKGSVFSPQDDVRVAVEC
jgi:hypothetical protein